MDFTHTLSRDTLLAIPAKRRIDAICRYVDSLITTPVSNAAAAGKTSYLFVLPKQETGMPRCHPPAYVVTRFDIIEGAAAKFPGCKVEFSDEWIEVRPGVREHREGVLIDWS